MDSLLVSAIAGNRIFSTMSLTDAFNQIPVKPEHQLFRAFKLHKVVFKYKLMSFLLQTPPQYSKSQLIMCWRPG